MVWLSSSMCIRSRRNVYRCCRSQKRYDCIGKLNYQKYSFGIIELIITNR